MYRRLKNILGASLMILAVVIAQIPMPETQAEETSTVTFSMNGGEFNGEYNGYSFNGQTPVLVLDNNQTIDAYPDEQYASYAGYQTENGRWYTDKECLEEFDGKSRISESVTIYKKWYSKEDGFCLNPDKTVLYQYDGGAKLVRIPNSVKIIAENAFASIGNARGIVLSKDIETVYDNAFSGVGKESNIVYIYDNDSSQSKQMAQKLADRYEQFVYSSYLDVDKVEEIAGIDYEAAGTETENTEGKTGDNAEDNIENKADEEQTDKNTDKNEAASEEQKETEKETEIKTEEAREYTVAFDVGIPNITGENRTVPAHSTVSELVSVSGEPPKILQKGSYTIAADDGKQETTYVFDGWYKDLGCTAEWNFANDTIERDTIIYAKWDRKTKKYYYVDFVADEAENVPEKLKLYEDEPLEKPSRTPYIKGRGFNGWYTDEEDSKTEYTAWGKTISQSLTLYAQWESQGYTVTFNMNGGKYSGDYDGKEYDGAASVKTKVEKGEGISKKAYPEYDAGAVFKYSGYNTDSNWYTDKECLSKYSKTGSDGNPKEVKKNLTLYKKWYASVSGFTMNPKKTVLYQYSGSSKNVKIPETVTTIGDDAFTNVSSIESVSLPDSLTDVEEDAFSGFEKASKEVALTAESDSAAAIAKELAARYKYLVYDKASTASDKNEAKSDSVSVINAKASGSITLGAAIGGSAGTTKTAQGTGSAGGNADTSLNSTDTSVSLGASVGAPVSGVTTSGIGANSVMLGETQQAAPVISEAPAASDDTAAQKPVSLSAKTKTTSKTNAAAASAPSSARRVKDSTPKTGDPIQYRMLLVCVLFSAGTLLVLTGNGKRKRFSPS